MNKSRQDVITFDPLFYSKNVRIYDLVLTGFHIHTNHCFDIVRLIRRDRLGINRLSVPDFVTKTFQLGKKNPVLNNFHKKDVLSEIDKSLKFK